MISKSKASKYFSVMLCLVSINILDSIKFANSASFEGGYLEGIGYREQALQQAKGAFFQSEGASGVSIASFGGGTNIFIQGVGLAVNPQSNVVMFVGVDQKLKDMRFIAPALTEDDTFLSNTPSGTLVYRIPSPHVLMGIPQDKLGQYTTMTFNIGVNSIQLDGMQWLSCKDENKCRLVYHRHFTPIMKYISPPVVYYEAEVQLVFDPKSIMSRVKDVDSDNLPFVQAKIGAANINFEGYVASSTGFRGWYPNSVRGKVGDQKIAKSLPVKMLWETGYAIDDQVKMQYCNYDATDCYHAKTVPAIYEVDQKDGYMTGGQVITVKGFGFGSGTIKATLDGVDCKVLTQTTTDFTCRAGSKATVSTDVLKVPITKEVKVTKEVTDAEGVVTTVETDEVTQEPTGEFTESKIDFVGQQGLSLRKFKYMTHWGWVKDWKSRMNKPDLYDEKLAMHFEGHENVGQRYAALYRGWFTPPATTKYRFHQSCDDQCDMNLGNTPGQSTDTTELLNIDVNSEYRRTSWTDWGGQTRVSAWVDLIKGEKYYIEAVHLENWHTDHFSMGVEIQQETLNPNHPNNVKEVQKLILKTKDQRETSILTINNPDTGAFRLTFMNPKTFKKQVSEGMNANMSAWNIREKIKSYYRGVTGGEPVVGLTMTDAEGNETTDMSKSKKSVYKIELDRLIVGESASSITVAKAYGKADIKIEHNTIKSGAPLSGKFKIKCGDQIRDGKQAYTNSINYNTDWFNIGRTINEQCVNMRNAVTLSDVSYAVSGFNHPSIGKAVYINFDSYNANPGQFEFVTDEDEPLVGEIEYVSETVVEYNKNLMFYPIPFEMLETFEEKPQMLVEIGDLPAVCHNRNCEFSYTENVGEVTAFTFTPETKVVTVTGTAFPTEASGIQAITFAQSPCTLNAETLTATSLECTLEREPVCGTYIPNVTTPKGNVPNAEGVTGTVVACTITGMSPDTSLNLLGYDNITFTGTNFPHNIDDSTFDLKFSDEKETLCKVQSSKSTEFVCLTSSFDRNLAVGKTYTMATIINEQVVENTQSFKMKDSIEESKSLIPNSASPVLKTPLLINLSPDFPYALNRDELSVNATSVTDSSYVRYLNIMSVVDTPAPIPNPDGVEGVKQLKVMFGGAESGIFQVQIRHKVYGLVDTGNMLLDVSSRVISFSPKVGSIYGGTLLTIKGQNFGDVKTDNPVQLSTAGGVGSIDCLVQTTQSDEITCRVNPTSKLNDVEAEMIVFLKTSEEAKCDEVSVCNWKYTSTLPDVKEMTTEYDADTETWQVKVAGVALRDSADSGTQSDLQINGVSQTVLTHSDTMAVFTVTDVQDLVQKDLNLFFPIGLPEGHDLVRAGITLEPKLTSISPNVGTTGRTLITATIQGVGLGTTGIDLVTPAGLSICSPGSIKVVAFSQVQCLTNLEDLGADAVAISAKHGETAYECAATDSAKCNYKQTSDGTFPKIESLTSTATTIVFTGSNFYTIGYSATASFQGIDASSVTLDSATQATATFDGGVPINSVIDQNRENRPNLIFKLDNSPTLYYSLNTGDFIKNFVNPFSLTSSTSGLKCSFNGGCELDMVGTSGVQTLFRAAPKTNYIKVCEQRCEYDDAKSTPGNIKCTLPPIPTTYSNQNFQIGKLEQELNSGVYFGNEAEIAFDGSVFTRVNENSKVCKIGMEFKAEYVGSIQQVKYFINYITDRSQYANNLVFEGYNDANAEGDQVTEIFKVTESVHEGWNYVDFEEGKYPNFRYYRFRGLGVRDGPCRIHEVTLKGIEVIENNEPTYSCKPELVMAGEENVVFTNAVVFDGALTPMLASIAPRFGTRLGGETVRFTGTNFNADKSLYTILIDGVACVPSTATTTYVECTTGRRDGLVPSSLSIQIGGMGLVSLDDNEFTYVFKWSDGSDTWGGEFAPVDGETIMIPKGFNLLMDIDTGPKLKAVLVQGALIFAPDLEPTHQRTFDASYIFVDGGKMELGTAEFPYTSKLTITMHSKIDDPYIPIYGNKCIGLRYGTLDMHGIPKNPVWTVMEKTAEAGEQSIQLNTKVDWVVGDQIAIASTSYNGREADRKFIVAIDRTDENKPILKLNAPLEFRHYAEDYEVGTLEPKEFIPMRAEVGVLSRNVVYRGNPEDSYDNEYGATIFMHSPGDDSLTFRASDIEFTDVGQAFKLGRYALHMHMIGAVHNSYIKNNAVHQSYNRAVAIHGTRYLRIVNNVSFEAKGHNIFIEDAVETHNIITGNLMMKTMRSMSLLNVDQTPAGMWITNPFNNFRDNHVAGSDRYGYWFDLQEHGMGANADTSICPENEKVGEFRGNHAHSTGRYGLRLFHQMIPRQFPCKPVVKDMKVVYDNSLIDDKALHKDPYWQNPAITAEFFDFVGWKCGRNAVICERMGDVRLKNFKAADNARVNMEMSMPHYYGEDKAQIDGALVIGRSNNIDPKGDFLDTQSPRGVEMPQREFFTVRNVRFYNYNWNNAAAIGTCSHCAAPEDKGVRTSTVEKLWFDDETVKRRIMWNWPGRAILYDLDGTTTGMGPGSWATPYFPHNNQPECKRDEVNDALYCDNTVQIRKLDFNGLSPTSRFKMQAFRILKFDDAMMVSVNREDYLGELKNYSSWPWLDGSWTVPFVTNHKYKLHWGTVGLDWDKMKISLGERWAPKDHPVYFVHNFTDIRAKMDVNHNGVVMENDTIPMFPKDYMTGQNILFEDQEIRELHWVVTGKQPVEGKITDSRKLSFVAHRCIGEACNIVPEAAECDGDDKKRLWSNPKDWDQAQEFDVAPAAAGEDLTITSGWNMVFDLAESPIYNKVVINGCLSFLQGQDLHLRAKIIFIQGGELNIGTKDKPYTNDGRITLYGKKEDPTIAIEDQGIEAGSKIIANIGRLSLYGKKRSFKMTRLTKPALAGDTEITIETNDVDLVEGDQIALAPTDLSYDTGDRNAVVSFNKNTGVVVLEKPLTWYHFGAAKSTAEKYNGVDMRGEVLSLSRNIKIIGDETDTDGHGMQILTADIMELDGTFKEGRTQLDSVEVVYGGQKDTENAAIRFENALTHSHFVKNSVIHDGPGWMLNGLRSKNLNFDNNVWWGGNQVGVAVNQVMSTQFNNNFVGWVTPRTDLEAIGMATLDVMGGALFCSLTYPSPCPGLRITNNICAGTVQQCFTGPAHDCGKPNTNFFNNVAHSVSGGLSGNGFIVYPDPSKPSHKTCYEVSGHAAYKCADAGVFTNFASGTVNMHSITVMDSNIGAGVMATSSGSQEYLTHSSHFYDSIFYGKTDSPNCPDKDNQCNTGVKGLSGIVSSVSSKAHKSMDMHPDTGMHCPLSEQIENGSWAGKAFFTNLKFIDYGGVTDTGLKNVMVKALLAPDFITLQNFDNTIFENCDSEFITYFEEPPEKWANLADCGDFPCTGPKNTIMSFTNTKWTGKVPANPLENFSLIPDIKGGYSASFPDCTQVEGMNGYRCTNNDLGILVFESNDADSIDRSMQPIYYRPIDPTKLIPLDVEKPALGDSTEFRFKGDEAVQNTLNSYMDHNCDSFYNSQQRISRFPGLVYSGPEAERGLMGRRYEVKMTGTAPKKMRWRLDTKNPKSGFTVVIQFEGAQSKSIMKDGEEVPYNAWVKPTAEGMSGEYGEVKQEVCGENRFVGTKNVLEFFINGECELQIQPRDAIQTKVRMEWTMDKFFAEGGTTSFIDRLCGSLGIHASTVKVVGVSPGSINVDYEITPTADEPMSLEQISAKQTQQFATGTLDLGAPILDVGSGGESIIADGVSVAVGFPSKIVTITASNQGSIILIDWVYPFLWEAAQVAAIDVPAHIGYEFVGGGLMWLWENLAEEVKDMAIAEGIASKHDAHVPNIVEDEGGIVEDTGNVGDISDENFG